MPGGMELLASGKLAQRGETMHQVRVSSTVVQAL